jgi:hypothetical protein
MKIAINGEIIDTENIWKISKLLTHEEINIKWRRADFVISLFNDNQIRVNHKDAKKVSALRESLIKIWSDNQSTIPQFNL